MNDLRFQPIENSLSINVTDQVKEVCDGMRALYNQEGFQKPWIGYLAINKSGDYVGSCAFKSPPKNGRVEIAYFTFPQYEGNGIATAMAKYLISLALEFDPQLQIFAQTLPKENSSNHILKNIGFQFMGQINHPEDGIVWEWGL